jgi:hypothetical protein
MRRAKKINKALDYEAGRPFLQDENAAAPYSRGSPVPARKFCSTTNEKNKFGYNQQSMPIYLWIPFHVPPIALCCVPLFGLGACPRPSPTC